MGIIFEKLNNRGLSFLSRRRISAIEKDYCGKARVGHEEALLQKLVIETSTISGGRRSVDIVGISCPGLPELTYGIKETHRFSEADVSRAASRLGVGPQVIDVDEISRGRSVILEEFFPIETNTRNRPVLPSEAEDFGQHLSAFFLAFIDEGFLLAHGDERPEHIYIVGEGKEAHVRLIDWGRGSFWPKDRFPKWAQNQFRWLYHQLAYDNPAIWGSFLNNVKERSEVKKIDPQALTQAYMAFVNDELAALTQSALSMSRPLAVRFLEFSLACGETALVSDPFRTFLRSNAGTRGEGLAGKFLQFQRNL